MGWRRDRKPDRWEGPDAATGPPGAASGRLSGPGRGQRLLWSWPGRVLLAGIAIRLLVLLASGLFEPPRAVLAVGSLATLAVLFASAWIVAVLLLGLKRRLLWRVRRTLVLSYVLIGFVPVLLLLALFFLAGWLMFFNIRSYLLRDSLDALVADAQVMAETAVLEMQRTAGPAGTRAVLERKQANAAARAPGLSLALVPVSPPLPPAPAPAAAGPWHHLPPPTALPPWIGGAGFSGILAYAGGPAEGPVSLLARAVALEDAPSPRYAVVVDLPVDRYVARRWRQTTGIRIIGVDLMDAGVRPAPGRIPPEAEPALEAPASPGLLEGGVLLLTVTDWETGRTGRAAIGMQVGIRDLYNRISASQARLRGDDNLSDALLLFLVVIAVLFLIIEAVALVMGFALARSITSSVHELFVGTERIRQGDFSHRIRVRTRDQLGELAESFNQMTGSIEELLRQAAEKKRLEEELRIAREIQMSLLPRGPFVMPGVSITALCVPAREVGGDYYDFFPLGPRRVGLLIADVAGKGTSAALYMAELKGIVLSLSRIYQSPRELAIEVNRLIAPNLDTRSFITMTYAVLDLEAGTLISVRAGHTPMIFLAARDGGPPRVIAPDGLVLGLQLAGIDETFEALLEEHTERVAAGDVFVLYTDGITEAMNSAAEMFGEERLAALIAGHAHLPPDELRERIVRDVEAFVGAADRHDDMTLILVKLEEEGVAPGRPATAQGRVQQGSADAAVVPHRVACPAAPAARGHRREAKT
jgi:phosphoserine phosphatase RsbU/P